MITHLLAWAEWLENPKHIQTTGCLARLDRDTHRVVGNCCLGGGCEVYAEHAPAEEKRLSTWVPCNPLQEEDVDYGMFRGSWTDLPVFVSRWLGFGGETDPFLPIPASLEHRLNKAVRTSDERVIGGHWQVRCVRLNDFHKFTFPEIAQCVRFLAERLGHVA